VLSPGLLGQSMFPTVATHAARNSRMTGGGWSGLADFMAAMIETGWSGLVGFAAVMFDRDFPAPPPPRHEAKPTTANNASDNGTNGRAKRVINCSSARGFWGERCPAYPPHVEPAI
jgi:hypothetical protein